VSLLPLHHPLRIAVEMAVLDVLSNGRIEVGIGRGMPQTKYAVFGVDPATVAARQEESLQIVLKAWTSEQFQWEGSLVHCPSPVTVRPRPVQRPHPPVWMPVSHDLSHAGEIGRRGFNLMTLPWMVGLPAARGVVDGYRAGLREAGLTQTAGETLGMMYTWVAETDAQARDEVELPWRRHCEVAERHRGSPDKQPRDYDSMVRDTRAIFGDPEMCRRQVRRLQDEVGLDRLALVFHYGGQSQDRILAAMRLFAEEVAPEFSDAKLAA
jgi:alkanesulfonate monooxygenase SsuD/methylene tetrahydromethanopterin reductase-like flavin-dependent oxidoreductase (luciferase family)